MTGDNLAGLPIAQRRTIWRARKAAQRAALCPPGKEAHHPDYAQPLRVECLTRRAHRQAHAPEGKETAMARNPTGWQTFSHEVLRSMPQGTSWAENRRALVGAGKLWRRHVEARRPNPLPERMPVWVWAIAGAGALWWLETRGRGTPT